VSRRFNFRTGCERIAPESLTDVESRSVPPDMVVFYGFNAIICFRSSQGAFSHPRIEGLRIVFLSIDSCALADWRRIASRISDKEERKRRARAHVLNDA
jgi:hypothetical protein